MTEKEAGGSAFPFSLHIGGSAGIVDAEECGAGGMTLRDYFAAKAISGACADSLPDKMYCDVAARRAYELADSMLRARR